MYRDYFQYWIRCSRFEKAIVNKSIIQQTNYLVRNFAVEETEIADVEERAIFWKHHKLLVYCVWVMFSCIMESRYIYSIYFQCLIVWIRFKNTILNTNDPLYRPFLYWEIILWRRYLYFWHTRHKGLFHFVWVMFWCVTVSSYMYEDCSQCCIRCSRFEKTIVNRSTIQTNYLLRNTAMEKRPTFLITTNLILLCLGHILIVFGTVNTLCLETTFNT